MPKKENEQEGKAVLAEAKSSPDVETRPDHPTLAWDPARVRQFLVGEISLGELEGIGKEEQYSMAEFGFRFLQQGKLDQAKKVFQGLVSLDPRDAYFYLVLGSIAQRTDDFSEAERCYSLSIGINPFSGSAFANRGEVRVLMGRLQEGIHDLRRALLNDPEAKETATARARALLPALEERLKDELGEDAVASEAPTDGKAPTVGHRLAEVGTVPSEDFASDDAERPRRGKKVMKRKTAPKPPEEAATEKRPALKSKPTPRKPGPKPARAGPVPKKKL